MQFVLLYCAERPCNIYVNFCNIINKVYNSRSPFKRDRHVHVAEILTCCMGEWNSSSRVGRRHMGFIQVESHACIVSMGDLFLAGGLHKNSWQYRRSKHLRQSQCNSMTLCNNCSYSYYMKSIFICLNRIKIFIYSNRNI